MTEPLTSLDELARLAADLPGPNEAARAAAAARQASLTKPAGALGRLEELAIWLTAWQGVEKPHLEAAQALVFAGNHGVTARGVSAFPSDVTKQMVANFTAGGAAINQLCAAYDIDFRLIALDLDQPTADFCAAPAMREAEFLAAVASGMAAVDRHSDILILGEMGIGNTTAAAAICHGLFGGAARDWVGRGTGVDDAGLALKAAVLEEAQARHHDAASGPLDIARRVGGHELAAILGAVLAARRAGIPVILDGFVCTAAAAPLARQTAGALDHCLAGHCSAEAGHRRLLDALALPPLLDLDMRLGEGSGAAMALGALRGALAAHNGMATFEEAAVSEKST